MLFNYFLFTKAFPTTPTWIVYESLCSFKVYLPLTKNNFMTKLIFVIFVTYIFEYHTILCHSFADVYPHTKNQIPNFVSGKYTSRILQHDWLGAFWTITHKKDFSRYWICNYSSRIIKMFMWHYFQSYQR